MSRWAKWDQDRDWTQTLVSWGQIHHKARKKQEDEDARISARPKAIAIMVNSNFSHASAGTMHAELTVMRVIDFTLIMDDGPQALESTWKQLWNMVPLFVVPSFESIDPTVSADMANEARLFRTLCHCSPATLHRTMTACALCASGRSAVLDGWLSFLIRTSRIES